MMPDSPVISPSFASRMFMGAFSSGIAFPFPLQSDEDRQAGDEFLRRLEKFLRETLDPDDVDVLRDVPTGIIQGLAEMGVFAMRIPTEYGGLGMSEVNYHRAISLMASYCASTTAWVSAHQSMGVVQPLLWFGTDEQKKKYLPMMAKGFLSAFALTEPGVGSDPARITASAEPDASRTTWTLNGEKLWCTNGPVADVFVVTACTPSAPGEKMPHNNDASRRPVTAFIVDRDTPGVEVVRRCEFMGLRGMQNGQMRFTDVRVPSENIIGIEGQGLKVVLSTLNSGRLAVSAGSLGMAKQSLRWSRMWAATRMQSGVPLGEHEAIAHKLARMASTVFAMEAVSLYASSLSDRKTSDYRMEAAMAKLFCSESCGVVTDETVQIRGGRGYETSAGQKSRGEKSVPAERFLRDARAGTIVEGSSEVMRQFIARDALAPHLRVAGGLFRPGVSFFGRVGSLLRSVVYYAVWYPTRWVHLSWPPRYAFRAGRLRSHLRFAHRQTRRLARTVFHAMLRHGPGLEKRQATLGRIVDIGVDIFAMTLVVSYACELVKKYPHDRTPLDMADLFCRQARRRILSRACAVWCHDDARTSHIAREVLDGKYTWLETGVLREQEQI